MGRPRRIEPGPGQESVWDYPRPPRVEPSTRHAEVVAGGVTVADSHRTVRVLETSGAPCHYFPRADVRMDLLSRTPSSTVCEWKGLAAYFDVAAGGITAPDAAWSYPSPNDAYAELAGWISFYPGRVEACLLDGEQVEPQPGGFYGGWVTKEIVGAFKGGPGTQHW